jgi:cytoskeletal protein CcmA (bactofilin family)
MAFYRKSEAKPSPVIPPPLKPEQQAPSDSNRSAASHTQADPVREESVIGQDLTIEGQSITIRCKDSLRVNGNIQADLHCVELSVGPQAMIVGSITAKKVAVSGRVNGAILGDNVVLHSTAHVEGEIHARSLSIEQGASFDGRSHKVTDATEVPPQLEPSPVETKELQH